MVASGFLLHPVLRMVQTTLMTVVYQSLRHKTKWTKYINCIPFRSLRSPEFVVLRSDLLHIRHSEIAGLNCQPKVPI